MKNYFKNLNLFEKKKYENIIKVHEKSKILIELLNSLTNEQIKFLKDNKLIDDDKDFKSYIYNKLSLSICQNKVVLDEDVIFHLWNIEFQKFLKDKKISIPSYKINIDYLPNVVKFVLYQLYGNANLKFLKKFIEEIKINSLINIIDNDRINDKKFKLIFALLFFYSLNNFRDRRRKREELKKYYKYKRVENVKGIVDKTKKELFKNIHHIILKYQAYIISGEKKLEDIFGDRKKFSKLNKFIPFKQDKKIEEGELFKELQQELKKIKTTLEHYETKKIQKESLKFLAIGEIIASLTTLIDGGIVLIIFNGMTVIYFFATKDNKKCKLLEKLNEIEADIKRKIIG